MSASDSNQNSNSNPDTHGHVLTSYKPKVARPSLYRVILLNDDFTPMDFVILILKKFFAKTDTQATEIMLQVHNQGAGTAGVFTKEISETKVFLVNEYSKSNRHPLKCIMEKETQGAEE